MGKSIIVHENSRWIYVVTVVDGVIHRERIAKEAPSRTPEYAAWASMKRRCYDTTWSRYRDWGGRGIKVCDRWLKSFEAFRDDVGAHPGPGYSLDRIDNDGDYEPGNVRWSTGAQQGRNRRPRSKDQRSSNLNTGVTDVGNHARTQPDVRHGDRAVDQ